jgi:hypothetical protein
MKTVSELAFDAIIEQNLILSENVGIGVVNISDWNGELRIVVKEDDSEIEQSQLQSIAQTTVLTVGVLSRTRDEAVTKCKLVSEYVYRYIEKLERKRGYGILAITKFQNGISNITDRTEFEAFRSFNVTNTINL